MSLHKQIFGVSAKKARKLLSCKHEWDLFDEFCWACGCYTEMCTKCKKMRFLEHDGKVHSEE